MPEPTEIDPAQLRLRIVSDGTTAGTYVADTATGRKLYGVTRIDWSTDWRDGPRILLYLEHVGLEFLSAEGTLVLPDRPRHPRNEGDPHAR